MKALIIANGELPQSRTVKKEVKQADIVICADGGANKARTMNIAPHIILGDFDSISKSTRKFFRNVPQMIIEDQYSTDLEKAIQYCIERLVEDATIVGYSGDRIDHTTGSLGCFKKFRDKINLRFIDSQGEITQIKNKTTFKAYIGEKISLIPLDHCNGVSTKNLKYRLKNDLLEIGVREGISNEATGEEVSVTVKSGTLLLYRFHH